jgi:hypothetical protein
MTDQLNPDVNQNFNQEVRPNNYLVGSIIATIVCCMPVGIISIIYASQVNSKYDAGDFAGAEKASKQAKQFMIGAIVVGLVAVIAYIGIFGATIISAANAQ